MKKATLIFAALAIMFMANMNVKAQCPDGWEGPKVDFISFQGCDYEYRYCYYLDPNTLEHWIHIENVDILLPCTNLGYEFYKELLTTRIISKILPTLVGTAWTDIAIPDCDVNIACFKRLLYPKCYKADAGGWEEIVVNGRPRLTRPYCLDNPNPRPCGLEIITICYEDLFDENGIFERRVYHTERFFWPSIPEYRPGMCPHKCVDNCY